MNNNQVSESKYGTKTASGNPRIFNCKKCNRAFTREEHLTRHTLSTHNKLKPFTCGICARPFSRRDLLLRHAKNLHQGSELAVSRIRKSYKRNDSNNGANSNDNEGNEGNENSFEDTNVSIEIRDPRSSATSESRSGTALSLSPIDNKYDTPDKKRLKMSVNMLVS